MVVFHIRQHTFVCSQCALCKNTGLCMRYNVNIFTSKMLAKKCIFYTIYIHTHTHTHTQTHIYGVYQKECARLRDSVPYVKVHRYNPKHHPKLNGYGDNGKRKVWSSCDSTYCTCSADALRVHCACP